MKNQELFYPDKEVIIGNYHFSKGIAVEVHSNKETAYDWAKIKFTGEFQENVVFQKKDKVSIRLGYDGNVQEVFSGFLNQSYNQAAGMDEILVKDNMTLLNKTEITNTYLSTTPQEIIEYGLKKAGISNYQLDNKGYPVKSKVPIIQSNFMDVLKKINQLWGINNTGYFIGETFYWGCTKEQTKTYQFEYGSNIISLTRENGLWMMATVSIPDIRHGMKICVEHPKISGTFEVVKTVFKTNEEGFLRTGIYFEDKT